MAKVDFTGLDRLKRAAEETKRKGAAGVPLNDLFSTDFMSRHTDFSSIDKLIKASGFNSYKDFNKIPDDFINSHTQFSTRDEMLKAAAIRWTKYSLGFK